jgi:hypothetical protein
MCCDVAGPQADKRETNTENKKNRSDGLSKLVSIGPDLNNLIDTLVLRKVEPILFCDRRRNEPGRGSGMEQVTLEGGEMGSRGK